MPKVKAKKVKSADAIMLHVVEYTTDAPGPKANWRDLPNDFPSGATGAEHLDGRNCTFLTGKDAAARLELVKSEFATRQYRGKSYRARITRYEATPETATMLRKRETWKAREIARFADGTYTPLPWADEPWFKDKHDYFRHFAHVGTKSRINIAYTMTSEHGALDRQTSIKPGKYLERYFGAYICDLPYVTVGKSINGDPIKVSVLQFWADKYAELYGDNVTLHFASDAEGFEYVYTSGPSSCMSHDASDFEESDGDHPVTVYAAGDLAVAYLVTTSGDDDENPEEGRITARALCWPDKKLYSRVYGDTYKLERELRKLGYVQNADWNLNGARLRRQYISRGDGKVLMPYIDAGCRIGDHPTDQKFLIMDTRGKYSANSTGGSAYVGGHAICAECDAEMTSTANEGYVCDECQYGTYQCSHSGVTYADVDGYEPITLANGCYVHPRYAHYYPECAVDGMRHHRADMFALADGRRVYRGNAADHTALCAATGARYLKTDLQLYAADGQWYCRAAYDALIHTAETVAA